MDSARRTTMLLQCLAVTLGLTACAPGPDAGRGNQSFDTFLLTRSVEQARMMGRMARSESFVRFLTPSVEMVAQAEDLGVIADAEPIGAFIVRLPDEAIASMIEKNSEGRALPSGELYRILAARVRAALPSIINGRQGSAVLALSSALGVETAIRRHRDLTEALSVILLYDGPFGSLTTFTLGEEDTGLVASMFLAIPPGMQGVSAGADLGALMDTELGIEGARIERIDAERLRKALGT